jgi:hypothetical protein
MFPLSQFLEQHGDPLELRQYPLGQDVRAIKQG